MSAFARAVAQYAEVQKFAGAATAPKEGKRAEGKSKKAPAASAAAPSPALAAAPLPPIDFSTIDLNLSLISTVRDAVADAAVRAVPELGSELVASLVNMDTNQNDKFSHTY